MMRPAYRIRTAALLLAMVAGVPLAGGAQAYTLADVFTNVKAGEVRIGFAASHNEIAARIDSLENFFRQVGASGLSLDKTADIYAGSKPGYTTLLRANRDKYSLAAMKAVQESLFVVTDLASGTLFEELTNKLGKDERKKILAPVDSLQKMVLGKGIAYNTERLRRFEIKYGPQAPTFNLAEAALNYVAQLWLPQVFLSDDKGPSPHEIFATYRTTDLTASKQPADSSIRPHVVSTAQIGWRKYNFDEKCGHGNAIEQVVNACQRSIGFFFLAQREAALRTLLHEPTSMGLYVSSGNFHIGIIPRQDFRLVVGTDTKVLPYIF